MVSPLYSGARILENATDILNSSLATLENATRDSTRLKKILKTEKVFGLVPDKDLRSAKESMKADVHPQLQYLLEKLEKQVGKLKKEQRLLQSKERLERAEQEKEHRLSTRPIHNPDPFKVGRLKFLQQKKKRLEQVLAERKEAHEAQASPHLTRGANS